MSNSRAMKLRYKIRWLFLNLLWYFFEKTLENEFTGVWVDAYHEGHNDGWEDALDSYGINEEDYEFDATTDKVVRIDRKKVN